MFGRTPRLPIDMMFDSALLDDQVGTITNMCSLSEKILHRL